MIKYINFYNCINLSLCLSSLFIWLRWNRISPVHQWMALYFTFNYLVDSLALIVRLGGNYNLWIYNIYSPLEQVIFIVIIRSFIENARIKMALLVGAVLLPMATFFNLWFLQNYFTEFTSNTYSLGCIFISIACVSYFYLLITNEPEDDNPLWVFPSFWIVSGAFIYYTGSLFIDLLINYLVAIDMNLAKRMFNIPKVLSLVQYGFIMVGLLCSKFKKVTT